VVGGEVIDVADGRRLGRVDGWVHGVAGDGRVLVLAEGWTKVPDEGRSVQEQADSEEQLIPPVGPLRWVRPAAGAPKGPPPAPER
jgi:hypothetical protein